MFIQFLLVLYLNTVFTAPTATKNELSDKKEDIVKKIAKQLLEASEENDGDKNEDVGSVNDRIDLMVATGLGDNREVTVKGIESERHRRSDVNSVVGIKDNVKNEDLTAVKENKAVNVKQSDIKDDKVGLDSKDVVRNSEVATKLDETTKEELIGDLTKKPPKIMTEKEGEDDDDYLKNRRRQRRRSKSAVENKTKESRNLNILPIRILKDDETSKIVDPPKKSTLRIKFKTTTPKDITNEKSNVMSLKESRRNIENKKKLMQEVSEISTIKVAVLVDPYSEVESTTFNNVNNYIQENTSSFKINTKENGEKTTSKANTLGDVFSDITVTLNDDDKNKYSRANETQNKVATRDIKYSTEGETSTNTSLDHELPNTEKISIELGNVSSKVENLNKIVLNLEEDNKSVTMVNSSSTQKEMPITTEEVGNEYPLAELKEEIIEEKEINISSKAEHLNGTVINFEENIENSEPIVNSTSPQTEISTTTEEVGNEYPLAELKEGIIAERVENISSKENPFVSIKTDDVESKPILRFSEDRGDSESRSFETVDKIAKSLSIEDENNSLPRLLLNGKDNLKNESTIVVQNKTENKKDSGSDNTLRDDTVNINDSQINMETEYKSIEKNTPTTDDPLKTSTIKSTAYSTTQENESTREDSVPIQTSSIKPLLRTNDTDEIELKTEKFQQTTEITKDVQNTSEFTNTETIVDKMITELEVTTKIVVAEVTEKNIVYLNEEIHTIDVTEKIKKGTEIPEVDEVKETDYKEPEGTKTSVVFAAGKQEKAISRENTKIEKTIDSVEVKSDEKVKSENILGLNNYLAEDRNETGSGSSTVNKEDITENKSESEIYENITDNLKDDVTTESVKESNQEIESKDAIKDLTTNSNKEISTTNVELSTTMKTTFTPEFTTLIYSRRTGIDDDEDDNSRKVTKPVDFEDDHLKPILRSDVVKVGNKYLDLGEDDRANTKEDLGPFEQNDKGLLRESSDPYEVFEVDRSPFQQSEARSDEKQNVNNDLNVKKIVQDSSESRNSKSEDQDFDEKRGESFKLEFRELLKKQIEEGNSFKMPLSEPYVVFELDESPFQPMFFETDKRNVHNKPHNKLFNEFHPEQDPKNQNAELPVYFGKKYLRNVGFDVETTTSNKNANFAPKPVYHGSSESKMFKIIEQGDKFFEHPNAFAEKTLERKQKLNVKIDGDENFRPIMLKKLHKIKHRSPAIMPYNPISKYISIAPYYSTKKHSSSTPFETVLKTKKGGKESEHDHEIGSELDKYQFVIRQMLDVDDEALQQYDWLISTVNIRAAMYKLLRLADANQNDEYIHPSDKELFDYVTIIYNIAQEPSDKILRHRPPKQKLYQIREYDDEADVKHETYQKKSEEISEENENYDKHGNLELKPKYYSDRNRKANDIYGNYDETVWRNRYKRNAYGKTEILKEIPFDYDYYDDSNARSHNKYDYENTEINKRDEKLEQFFMNGEIRNFDDDYDQYDDHTEKDNDLKYINDYDGHMTSDYRNEDCEIEKKYMKTLLALRILLLPRNRRKKPGETIKNPIALMRDVMKFILRARRSDDKQLEDFKEFIYSAQDGLHHLHSAIKEITLNTEYEDQHIYEDLKHTYLKQVNRRKLHQLALHLSLHRLFELIEESVNNGLEKNLITYLIENEKEVTKTVEEMKLVLKLIKVLKNDI